MTIGKRNQEAREEGVSCNFSSVAPRIHPPAAIKNQLAPGEYFQLETKEMEHERSFARKPSGAPQGSPTFESVVKRMQPEKTGGGFPRPMRIMDAEESRSRWDASHGKTVSGSDRWKGGIFDGDHGPDLPLNMKGRGPSLVDRVMSSPIRYSEMKAQSTRTTDNPSAFSTHEGVRGGSNASYKQRTRPNVGPGSYDITKGKTVGPPLLDARAKTTGGRSSKSPVSPMSPSSISSSPFKSRLTREFTNMHPAFTVGGRSPNTLTIKRHPTTANNYDFSWDSKHWARPGRTSTISAHEAPNILTSTAEKNNTPGPGFYHKATPHWEDEKASMRATTSPSQRR